MDTVSRIFELVDRQFREQRDFAKAIGISSNIVSNWRCGRSGTYTKYLPVIARVLGTSVEYLLTGEDHSEKKPRDLPGTEQCKELMDAMSLAELTDMMAYASRRVSKLAGER